MKQNFTLNTQQKFADFDAEINAQYEFDQKHPFGKTLHEITKLLDNDLPKYDIGLGVELNELQELCGSYEYGFNCSAIQIQHLVEEVKYYLTQYDFIYCDESDLAIVERSNHEDVAKLFNELVTIATA